MAKKIPPALAKFQRRVKQIQKQTGKSYRSAQKQASAEKKGKTISGRKKPKKAGHKSKSTSRRMGSVQRPENLRGVVSNARKELTAELGWLLATQRTARTKREKKALQPKINELTRQIKALESR
jgi:hypothetical protein